MQNLDTIHNYLRLCCGPHNSKYVAMSVMLSCFTKHLSFGSLTCADGHITCILG